MGQTIGLGAWDLALDAPSVAASVAATASVGVTTTVAGALATANTGVATAAA